MEVKMIENYIALKKLEYKGSIDIRFQTRGQPGDPVISPGLFLPLLEIGIEWSGDSPRKTSVAIEIRSGGGAVYFSLINNMPGKEIVKDPSVKTTLHAVRNRLQSSYFQRSKLDVFPATDSLKIVLQTAKT
jgi:LytS/YehU family sensor histidine kinase